MEKLQAALARAREKRDGTPTGPKGRPQFAAKKAAVKSADAQDVDERWAAIQKVDPSARRMRQARIYSADATTDSTHFDILRTKLLLEMRRNGWTRIAITSATAGCGKSTAACNLIAGIGRQQESRAILFDLDFRRPSVAKFFGLAPEASLPDVLDGSAAFEDHACRLHDNTMLSLATRAVRDPAQFLLKARTSEFLDQIQADYRPELMLFDLPPILVSDEARALLKLVDASLIVASAGHTTVEQIDECEREVAAYTNVAGVVLNKCRHMDAGYSYSY